MLEKAFNHLVDLGKDYVVQYYSHNWVLFAVILLLLLLSLYLAFVGWTRKGLRSIESYRRRKAEEAGKPRVEIMRKRLRSPNFYFATSIATLALAIILALINHGYWQP